MKRAIALFLLIALLFSLTGCMTAEEKQARKEALDILNGNVEEIYSLSTGTTVGQQTLLEYDDILIELAGLRGTPTAPELVLAIRNGSRSTIGINIDHLSINDWQVSGWCSLYEIEARTVTLAVIECSDSLSLCGVEDIGSIDLGLSIYDTGSYDTLAAASVCLSTSAPADLDWSYVPAGKVLLENEEWRVSAVYFPVTTDQGSVTLCVENDSARQISVTTTHVRLNGEPIEFWFWYDVYAGERRLSTEWLYDEDTFDPLPISPGDELTFDLEISDYDTGVTLTTQSITLSPDDL